MKKILFALVLAFPFVFTGCSSDENDNAIILKSSEVTLIHTEKHQIDATSDSKIMYRSEDEYHAKVSESGLITAGKVGETNILLTSSGDTKKVKVIVKPESTMYPEPNLEFGISKDDLIKKIGTPNKETSNGIGYNNFSTKAPDLVYLFDTNNKLKSVGVIIKTAYTSELSTYLGERYVYGTSIEEDYTLLFVNALKLEDVTMMIGASLYNTSYWMAIYMPYSNKNTRVQKANEMDEVAKFIGIN